MAMKWFDDERPERFLKWNDEKKRLEIVDAEGVMCYLVFALIENLNGAYLECNWGVPRRELERVGLSVAVGPQSTTGNIAVSTKGYSDRI